MAVSGRLEELQRKFEENPRRFFAPLANEYRKAGNVERAIEICQEYLPQQPGHMSGYVVYGQALFDGGRHPAASDAFRKALAVDPENIIALRHLGDIARYAGERDVAVRWYQRVVEVDPKNEEVAAYLTQLSSTDAAPAAHTAVPPVVQAVRPEPAPDPDAVVLGDLVEQPDIPIAKHHNVTASELTWDQFGGGDESDGDAAEAKAALDQMLADPQGSAAPVSDEIAEPTSALPLITEFTMSADVVEMADAPSLPASDISAPPVAEPVVAEPEPVVAESVAPEPVTTDPFAFEYESAEEPQSSRDSLGVPFVTETMADLYLQQGFTAQALDVYRRLAANGGGADILEKIERLEQSMIEEAAAAQRLSSATAPLMTVRDFFSRIGARRPGDAPDATPDADRARQDLGVLFGAAPLDESDAHAAAVLASAYPAAAH